MCHALLQDPKFFRLLLQIDIDEAAKVQACHCPCGSVLHKADYPRKPRGCPREFRPDFESRLSFCCSRCRKRSTAKSVRFLGRRVYLGLAVVLMSVRRTTLSATAVQLCDTLGVPARTIARWRSWWLQLFPATPLWQAVCARFMPPVEVIHLPPSLIARFTGSPVQSMHHLLGFLKPLTARSMITLPEGR